MNKQGCCLGRKGQENAVIVDCMVRHPSKPLNGILLVHPTWSGG